MTSAQSEKSDEHRILQECDQSFANIVNRNLTRKAAEVSY